MHCIRISIFFPIAVEQKTTTFGRHADESAIIGAIFQQHSRAQACFRPSLP